MKRITYLILGAFTLMGIVSCDLEDNIDPKHASNVPAETVLTNALVNFVNQYNEMNVNRNTSRSLAQYWSDVTYTDASRYNFKGRSIPDTYWRNFYRNVLMDLDDSKRIIEASGLDDAKTKNQLAVIEVLNVYTYSVLAETFGNIAYTEALQGADNFFPKYDDAATVYADLFVRLDAAIAAFNASSGSFGSAELLFDGDINEWVIFANSLKLRMAMRMADVPSFDSKTKVEAALAAGVYDANLEGAFFDYIGTSPHVNTIYNGFVIDGRDDYVPSHTLIELMVSLNDPRLPLWFTTYEGEYKGINFGDQGSSPYSKFSHFTEKFFDPKLEVVLSDYAEMEFFLAEAVERNYAVGGTAEEHYNNAITASILYYGGSEADAATYLAQPSVAYGTAAGSWKQKIGTQKWLAMYNRGIEGWSEWRRLDFPILNVPVDMTYDDIPVRMPYPFSEKNTNPSYEAAVEAMGGDKVNIKLWFDKF